jgi:hypothetical protein
LTPRAGERPARAFAFLSVEGDDEPGEEVDLKNIARGSP